MLYGAPNFRTRWITLTFMSIFHNQYKTQFKKELFKTVMSVLKVIVTLTTRRIYFEIRTRQKNTAYSL